MIDMRSVWQFADLIMYEALQAVCGGWIKETNELCDTE